MNLIHSMGKIVTGGARLPYINNHTLQLKFSLLIYAIYQEVIGIFT